MGETQNGAGFQEAQNHDSREETNMAIQKKSLIGNLSSSKKIAPAKTSTPSVPAASSNVNASVARLTLSKATAAHKLSKQAKPVFSKTTGNLSKFLPAGN
jgi:hypothetical protein